RIFIGLLGVSLSLIRQSPPVDERQKAALELGQGARNVGVRHGGMQGRIKGPAYRAAGKVLPIALLQALEDAPAHLRPGPQGLHEPVSMFEHDFALYVPVSRRFRRGGSNAYFACE